MLPTAILCRLDGDKLDLHVGDLSDRDVDTVCLAFFLVVVLFTQMAETNCFLNYGFEFVSFGRTQKCLNKFE